MHQKYHPNVKCPVIAFLREIREQVITEAAGSICHDIVISGETRSDWIYLQQDEQFK